MAEANISVNKQTVLQLLKSGQEVPFLIPEYQRPYSWSDDEIITLFDDIWGFSIDRTQPNGAKSYFLGCVVSYKENGVRQIIDGQQRITALMTAIAGKSIVFDDATRESEFGNLQSIKDNYPKYVISMTPLVGRQDSDGITHLHLRRFLKEGLV